MKTENRNVCQFEGIIFSKHVRKMMPEELIVVPTMHKRRESN